MAYIREKSNSVYLVEKKRINDQWKENWTRLGLKKDIPKYAYKQILENYRRDSTYLKLKIDRRHDFNLIELCEMFCEHQKQMTFKKFATLKRERTYLNNICKQFGTYKITEIEGEYLTQWYRHQGYRPKTIALYNGVLKMVFDFAIKKSLVKKNPAKDVVRPPIRRNPPKHVDPKDIDLAFSMMTDRQRAPYEIMYYTGLRPSETLRLQVKNIDLNRRTIDLYPGQTKTATRGLIPIHQKLMTVFSRLMMNRKKGDFLFPAPSGEGHQKECKRGIATACRKANKYLKSIGSDHRIRITPYQFRHTFGTMILEKTGNLRTTQQAMRHSDIKMTTIYATSSDAMVVDAVNSLS